MTAAAGLLVDAALFAAAAMTLLLAVAIGAAALPSVSSHVRHDLLVRALIAGPLLFGGFILLRPGPVGCVTVRCASVDVTSGSRASQHYALEAAAKFPRDAPPVVASTPRPGTGLPTMLGVAWLTGAVLVVVRLSRRRLRLRDLIGASEVVRSERANADVRRIGARLGLRRPPRLLRHPLVTAPVVGGAFRPAVFLPERFERMTASERRIVLLHELTHVRRRDAGHSLLVELVTVLFWFHPLVWVAGAYAARLQEIATDSRVVEEGVLTSEYAAYLLYAWGRLSGRGAPSPPTVLSITGGCMITDRIHALLDPRSRHETPRRSLRLAITAGCLALFVGALWSPAMLPSSQAREDGSSVLEAQLLTPASLDSLLRPVFINRMTDRYVAGAAISIVHEGRTVYAAGFGDREVYAEDAVDPATTIFRIGSITKVLTGLAVMQLVDRGLVDLDADVNRYLSEVRVPDAFPEPVRVRHLLTHTAGFDQIGLDRHAASPDEVEPLGQWLSGKLIRIRPPGEVSAYDTYGITLAGHLVEAVSGLTFEEYLQRHVFGPLQMHRSGITVPAALAADVAVGYGFAGEWEAMPWEYMNTGPASTVNATVLDMAKLAAMFLAEGRAESSRLLGRAATRAMLTRQFTNHPDHPGYGFTFFEGIRNGVRTFSHGGSMSGYSAMLTLVPDHDLGIFIAYNQESGALIDPVLDALFGALFPTGRPEPLRERYAGQLDLSRFSGTYANNVYHHGNPETGWRRRPVPVTVGDGDASGAIVFDGAPAWPIGPLTFQREDGLLISFLEDPTGTLTHMVIGQAVYEKLD